MFIQVVTVRDSDVSSCVSWKFRRPRNSTGGAKDETSRTIFIVTLLLHRSPDQLPHLRGPYRQPFTKVRKKCLVVERVYQGVGTNKTVFRQKKRPSLYSRTLRRRNSKYAQPRKTNHLPLKKKTKRKLGLFFPSLSPTPTQDGGAPRGQRAKTK